MTTPEFLSVLARSSAQAGALALLIFAAQGIFHRQLSPRWRCTLWLLVALRLLVPVSVGSAISLFNLMPQWRWQASSAPVLPPVKTAAEMTAPAAESQLNLSPTEIENNARRDAEAQRKLSQLVLSPPAAVTSPETPDKTAPSHPVADSASAAGAASAVAVPVSSVGGFFPVNWPTLLFGFWLAGVVALSSYLLLSSLMLARRFRHGHRLQDANVEAQLLDAQRRLGVASPLPIYECDQLHSPALYGCWRPRLLLPAGFVRKFSSDELGYVFLHELAHVKRRDLPVNWLLSLLQVVHWFNPLVWFAFSRWRADREMACDAMVLEAAGPAHNEAYGQTILRILESFTPRTMTPGLVGIIEDKRLLRERIRQIATFAPRRHWPILAVTLMSALALVGLTDAQVAAPPVAAAAATPPLPPTSAPATVAYTLTKLGTLGGKNSAANAINFSGQVVGWAENAEGNHRAFLFSGSKMLDLGTLGGNASSAFAINSMGDVAGQADGVNSALAHAFHYSSGTMYDNGNSGDGGGWGISTASGINDSGQITGTFGSVYKLEFDITVPGAGISELAGGLAGYAFLDNGRMRRNFSDTLANGHAWGSFACAVNSAGQFVGVAGLGGNVSSGMTDSHAFLFDGAIGPSLGLDNPSAKMHDLGTLGGHNSVARAINDHGQIVGWADTTNDSSKTVQHGEPHAFLYDAGKMQDLGTLNGGKISQANAINASGQIVGMSSVSDGSFHAFLYSDGKMKDLNDLVGKAALASADFKILKRANGINSRGQVVGVALDASDNEVAFLLTPENGAVSTNATSTANVVPATTVNSPTITTADSPKGLHFAAGPADGAAVALAAALRLPFGPRMNLDADTLRAKAPLAIYTLTPDDIVKGRRLDVAQAFGFQYRIESAGVTARVAEVRVEESGVTRFASLGNVVAVTAALESGLDYLATLDQVRAGSYEARLLRGLGGPGGGASVLWLKSNIGGEDMIYTLDSVPHIFPGDSPDKPTVIKAETLYSAADFLKIWRPYLRNYMGFPSQPLNWASEGEMNAYFVKQFVASAGNGMSRMPSPTMEVDDLMRLMISDQPLATGQKSTATNSYKVDRLELIGIAKHDPPVAFVSSDAPYHAAPSSEYPPGSPYDPRLRLTDAKTRALTDAEAKAVSELRTGKDATALQPDKDGSGIFVGAVRAQQICLECHSGAKVGDLLGAFSYRLSLASPSDPGTATK